MSAKEHLRLAWQADRAGRHRLRDVMLTLAIAESEPGESWGERGRLGLIRRHPGHFFSKFTSLADALLADDVQRALVRLREKYPPARVQWLLLAGDASRGIFTGREPAQAIVLQELLGPPAEADVRRDAAEPLRGPVTRSRTAVAARVGIFPAGHSVFDASASGFGPEAPDLDDTSLSAEPARTTYTDDESLSSYYLSVLFSMALLLSLTQGQPQEYRRAG